MGYVNLYARVTDGGAGRRAPGRGRAERTGLLPFDRLTCGIHRSWLHECIALFCPFRAPQDEGATEWRGRPPHSPTSPAPCRGQQTRPEAGVSFLPRVVPARRGHGDRLTTDRPLWMAHRSLCTDPWRRRRAFGCASEGVACQVLQSCFPAAGWP